MKTIDNTHEFIRYGDGEWTVATGMDVSIFTNGDAHLSSSAGATVSFVITGTMLQIKCQSYKDRSSKLVVYSNGVEIGSYSINNSSSPLIVFEKIFDTDEIREIVIRNEDSGNFVFDSININGEILEKMPEVPVGNPLTFHKTLESNLPEVIEDGSKQIHFTEKGNMYTYTKTGDRVQIGHNHVNTDVLSQLSKNEDGKLMFDGEIIGSGGGLNEMVLSSREW